MSIKAVDGAGGMTAGKKWLTAGVGLALIGGIVAFGLSAGGTEQAAPSPTQPVGATCEQVQRVSEDALKTNVKAFAKVKDMMTGNVLGSVTTEPHLFDHMETGSAMTADYASGLPAGTPCDLSRYLSLSMQATQLRLDIENLYDNSHVAPFEGTIDPAVTRWRAATPGILQRIDSYVAEVRAA